MGDLLQIEKVNKAFGDFHVLKDISFSIPKGGIFGLLGPNGAGKTTLIRIITQITGPDSGRVLLNGQSLAKDDIHTMGYLPEERGLYRKMKVWDQALYLVRLKGLSKREAETSLKEWFTRFEMQDWPSKRVETLSKGMQQKLQFVIAVAHRPQLLILDEPFSGFDPVNTELVKQQILRLKEEGTTMVFSTHNMASVEELCDEIALINKGEAILNGKVESIRSSFSKSLYELRFKGSSVSFANALGIDFEIQDMKSSGNEHKVILKAHNQQPASKLLQRLIPVVEVISFQEQLPSMHDIFLDRIEGSATEQTDNE